RGLFRIQRTGNEGAFLRIASFCPHFPGKTCRIAVYARLPLVIVYGQLILFPLEAKTATRNTSWEWKENRVAKGSGTLLQSGQIRRGDQDIEHRSLVLPLVCCNLSTYSRYD